MVEPTTTSVGLAPGSTSRSPPPLTTTWSAAIWVPRMSKRRKARPLPSASTRARKASVSCPTFVLPVTHRRPP